MVLDDNDMLNITFEVIKEQPGDKTAFELMQKCCHKIKEKVNSQIDTQEICDDVCNCMDYYNDFVQQKNIQAPIIGENYYNMVVIVLNALIGEVLNENERA